jgi:hypothetical protein
VLGDAQDGKKHIIDTAEKHEKSEQEKASASSSGNNERKEADVANRRNRSSKEKDSKSSAIVPVRVESRRNKASTAVQRVDSDKDHGSPESADGFQSAEEKERTMMGNLEEIVQEMRLEMRELRTEVQKSNAVVLHESSARSSGETMSVKPLQLKFLFSAEAMQVDCVKRIKAAERGDIVYLIAYSFDRRDVVEALMAAHRSGVSVRLALDSKQTLKGPKEQFVVVQELVEKGLEVRVVSGVAIKDAYSAAGRNVSCNFMGIQHMKMLAVEPKNVCEPGWVTLGSANWTTSSRANVETSVRLEIDRKDRSWQDLMQHLNGLGRQSISLVEADVKAAQWNRSQSPGR